MACALVLATSMLPECGREPPATRTLERESPAVSHPEIAGRRLVVRQEVIPPLPAPAFRLLNRTGSPIGLEDLRGKVVVLSFIYTNCPDACPLLGGNYLMLQAEFADALERGDLALVFITTDPERDTPERLQRYTQAVGGQWFFLTGSMAELQEVWKQYQVHREVIERTKEIIIYHSYKTILIDRRGRMRVRHIGVWYPEDIVPDIRSLLAE